MPIVTRTELKTYLGLTTTTDDSLLDQLLLDAEAQAEQDTGRVFAASSNVSRMYSTNGQSALVIHDRPLVDPSRTVVWNGGDLTEDTNVWFLPDRRDPDITTTIQLHHFDRTAFAHSFGWFDRNLDTLARRGGGATPNDLIIRGIEGHPFPDDDVRGNIRLLAAWMYWRAKSKASGVVRTPTGEEIELAVFPPAYAAFVERWRIRTGVTAI